MAVQGLIETKECRAIRADSLGIASHVDEDVGMIERGQGADAHEFLRSHANDGDSRLVVEMRRGMIGHRQQSWLVRTRRNIGEARGFG